eukprot:TRINITY_DN288_c0_g1_i6.p1 TRINITY_DN288_c0_g1~~TRINITY_DN288_c0_g1_i6.p1  ORF type:complete len:932 (+),score=212.05 TRINITY_DN288_c0_g1_i6:136-2931(+)
MSQKRKLIQWSPHSPNNFIVGSTELRLYDIIIKKGKKGSSNVKFWLEDPTNESFSRKDEKSISLLCVNYEVNLIKCLAWCPESADQNLIAVGLQSGKVQLTSLTNNRITKEFVPKHTRSCNAVAWNPVFKNQLAVGLDKVRGDCSTLVWDVNQTGSSMPDSHGHSMQTTDNSFNIAPMEVPDTIVKPFADFSNSEATTALAWLPSSPHCLVTGTGVKWLRLYDLRGDTNAPQSVVAHSKSVHGVCFDPFKEERLATFSEDGLIKLWDIRNFQEAVFTLNTNSKGLLDIQWCPTRTGILASISRDEKNIKFWDLKDITSFGPKNDKGDSNVPPSKPARTHETQEPLSSFSWHPTNQYRVLTVTNSGIVEVVSLQESIPLTWSPQGDVSFGFGKHLIEVQSDTTNKDASQVSTLTATTKASIRESFLEGQRFAALTGPKKSALNAQSSTTGTRSRAGSIVKETVNADEMELYDISYEMKRRAMAGYSMDLSTNKRIAENFSSRNLRVLWSWMYGYASSSYNFAKDTGLTIETYRGISSILATSTPPSKKIESNHDKDKGILFPVYQSVQRSACMQICSWGFDKKDSLEQTLTKLEAESQYERAAAIAIFYYDVRRAITALNRASTSSNSGYNLKLVAMALAGSSEQNMKGGLWKDVCVDPSSLSELKHPYLHACFSFLCNDSKTFKNVLDLELSLNDKVAFACRFLDDTELSQFITNAISDLTKQGALEGILLTGLDAAGITIFEQYINNTSDIQTAVLALSHVVPKRFTDARVEKWVRIYRDLLDNWQLWHERARFDATRVDNAIPQQVYVRCNFCNQPLSRSLIAPRRGAATSRSMAQTNKMPTQQQKVSSCPGCKKPLPRCSLCLVAFNCNIPNIGGKGQATAAATTPFDDWFTWCQTCRHGGHAAHMIEWFSTHSECPVTDCHCSCSSL